MDKVVRFKIVRNGVDFVDCMFYLKDLDLKSFKIILLSWF